MLDLLGSKANVTEEVIRKIGIKLNRSIPEDLVQFYIRNNGGYCEKNTFFIAGEGYKINEFLPFSVGSDTIESTYQSVFLENEEMPDNLVPFAVDAGGDYFCFDSSESGFGRIFFFESEYYDDPERSVVFLSKSFTDFVESLEVDR
ncbi:SMI1/KNR4 family protein [Vibrio metschnikovii]|jgi:hypothetical protein|uniref:SMI1/KNR4 family protein n=1 Tax=Vibrio metschnikovii TaxID=28172 RepID=UPI001C30028F|nr:SMI1/KNR4 family protein [Vibrio metschnikovii]